MLSSDFGFVPLTAAIITRFELMMCKLLPKYCFQNKTRFDLTLPKLLTATYPDLWYVMQTLPQILHQTLGSRHAQSVQDSKAVPWSSACCQDSKAAAWLLPYNHIPPRQ